MVKEVVEIKNEQGLHARPAALLAKTAAGFAAKITIRREGAQTAVNVKSPAFLLTLGLAKGSKAELIAEGEDEQQAAEAVIQLIAAGFGEA